MSKKDLLKEYNRKRDFSVTAEPSGRRSGKKGKKLSFVVQEHHASHLHWDFRLEMEGVLKSWAVPKGPSLDPADKRLAMMTEDHPLEYGKFHGRIPEGEYGAGEVFIWDEGTWEPEKEDPVSALKKGRIEFTLNGKKLKGKWILVRTRYKGREDDRSWLLIKRHDEMAVSGGEAEQVKRKAQGKDPWPGFIEPQLPRLVDAAPPGEHWVHELKFDGYRIQAHIKNGIAVFYTRNGNNWSNHFPFLLEAAGRLPVQNAILDGEVVAFNDEGQANFQSLQGSFKQKDDQGLIYYVFDILYLNGTDLRGLPLLERKELLREAVEGQAKNIAYSESFCENAEDFFTVSCEQGLEGIISKQADAPYRSGRSDLWTKTKCGQRQEFIIGGWTEPKGGRTGIGALLLGVYEGGELRFTGKVGTGFNHASLRELRSSLGRLEQSESPFDQKSPRGKDIHWVKPIKVCEVSFSEWTKDKMLRAPVFQGMREDKPAEDIVLEKPKKKKKAGKARGLAVSISSPDKVLFPKEKITKKQVAEYYQLAARHMLPYMKDRPLSLVRCPNGSEQGCFFQKHIGPGQFDHVEQVPIEEEKGSEGIYLSVNSAEGILELIQINAYELHAWGAQKDDYLHPDFIVMDLDPGPGVAWKQVVEAAFEMKELLEDLGLESFVKLTGGKGLHVCFPVLPLYDWEQVKAFTQSLAHELVSRRPDFYTATISKKARNKKIFVDYLRNGFGATAVVPYSLRARPVSAVAMPVDWKELRKIKNPGEFTLEKALKKLKARRSDPWKRMLQLRQRIEILKPAAKGRKAA